jgi:hypothetical protein
MNSVVFQETYYDPWGLELQGLSYTGIRNKGEQVFVQW